MPAAEPAWVRKSAEPQHEPLVVPLVPEDIPAVLEIQRASFTAPWSEAAIRRELDLAWSSVVVIKDPPSGTVMGIAGFWTVGGEVQLLNIAVLPQLRKRGLGRRLLVHVVDRARADGCRSVILEVRPSNVEALALYERFGFHRMATRKRYYQDNGEDALILELKL